MKEVSRRIYELGIVPVVKLERPQDALPLGKALCRGGLPVAEITFRTDAAEESIRTLSQTLPEMLVGAGTVHSVRQAETALEAGARFIVTPGFQEKVVRFCQERGVPVYPGCNGTSDLERALDLGLDEVKFFPAEASGGLKVLKSLFAPYGGMRFMPTGGITTENMNAYLSCPQILAVGGSWMVKESLIAAGDFAEVERQTRQAVNTMLGFQLRHVGINSQNEAEARETAELFSGTFGWETRDAGGGFFAGDAVEVVKTPYLGRLGHLAIAANNVDRAKAYLAAKGLPFRENTAQYDGAGRLRLIYLGKELGGFAVHLTQK